MKDTRRLELLESVAVVAQDSAEHGQIDPRIYADVFELIVAGLQGLSKDAAIAFPHINS